MVRLLPIPKYLSNCLLFCVSYLIVRKLMIILSMYDLPKLINMSSVILSQFSHNFLCNKIRIYHFIISLQAKGYITMWTYIRRDHPQTIKFSFHECPNVPLAVGVNACGAQFSFGQPPDNKISIISCCVYYQCTLHRLFICKSQPFTKMHPIFPNRNKWYLKT